MHMTRIASLVSLLAVFALGCATGASTEPRPADVSRPEITFAQRGEILFGGGNEAPVQLLVQIRNTAKVPLVVREIEVSSPQTMYYSVGPSSMVYAETIPPGETRTLPLTARVYSETPDKVDEEPLSVRAFVLFDVEGKRFRETVMQRNISQVR